MKRSLFYIIPLIALIYVVAVSYDSQSSAETPTTNHIEIGPHQKLWSEKEKLVWDDFKGKPNKQSPHDAVTTSSLKTQPVLFTERKVQYELVAVFDKKKSWTKSDSKELLAHEQVHFDISELVMRKMRKKFMNHNFKSLDGVNEMIDSIFEEASNERNKLNREYDKETNHSRKKEEQLEWQKRIEEELTEFSDYSSILVTLTK